MDVCVGGQKGRGKVGKCKFTDSRIFLDLWRFTCIEMLEFYNCGFI